MRALGGGPRRIDREKRQATILLRDHRRRLRPGDGERRIVPAIAAGGLGSVGLGNLVGNLGGVLQGLKTVGHPLGNVKLIAEIRGQHDREMLSQGGRAGPQVHDHVPEGAAGDPHELHLFVGSDLKMEPADRAPPVIVGDAALVHQRLQPPRREVAAAEGAGEEAALVREALRLQDPGARQRRLAEDHARTFTSGMATTKRPPQERTSAICSMISSLRFHGRMRT